MKEYSKSRHIWRALWPFLAFMGIQVAISVAGMIFLIAYYLISIPIAMDMMDDVIIFAAEQLVLEHMLLMLLISSLISLALYIPLWRATRKTHTQLNTGTLGVSGVLLVSGMFIGLNLAIVSIMDLTPILDYFPSYIEHMETLANGHILLQILVVGILVPVVEELCFRGVVLNRLASWAPTWVAVLISSALFGLLHLNLFQSLYATIIGVLCGWVYIRTRNLWASIAGHIAFNSINIGLVHYLEVTGTDWPSALAIIPMAVLTVICTIMLRIQANKRSNPNGGEVDCWVEFSEPSGSRDKV